ncbi:MAG: hypothetical protein WDO74_29840 [Pseudomonadota bacterium]
MRGLPLVVALSWLGFASQGCGKATLGENEPAISAGASGRGGAGAEPVEDAGTGGASEVDAGAADAGAAGENTQQVSFSCKAPSSAPWQPIGPLPYRTLCKMARDPRHPQTLLATNSHGWFMSEDEGATWCELSSSPDQPWARTTAQLRLVTSAAYPQKMFVQGAAAYMLDFSGQRSSEVEWTYLGSDVEVDPHDPRRILAAGGPDWLSVSTDGERFEQIPQVPNDQPLVMDDIAFDPQHAGVVYGSNGYSLWKSLNRGKTWSQLNSGLRNIDSVLALDTVPSALFVSSATDGWTYRSLDQGKTFEPIPAAGGLFFAADRSGSELFSNGHAGEAQLSTDAGKSWQAIALNGDLPCGAPLFDPDTVGRLLAPTETALLEIEDHQVLRRRPSHLLPDGALLDPLRAKPNADDRHLAAVRNGALFLSDDGGLSFERAQLDVPVERAVFDHGLPAVLFAFAHDSEPNLREIRYSEDFGQSFKALPFAGYFGLQLDDLAPGTLYGGSPADSADSNVGACWYSRSQNLGASWHCIWPPQNSVLDLCGGTDPVSYDRCSQVVFASDPRDSNILFVLTSDPLPSRIGKSKDGGKTWARIGPPASVDMVWTLSASNPDRMLVTGAYPPAIWLSVDGGATFDKQNEAFARVWGVEAGDNASYYGMRYDTTPPRLARSSDGGASWSTIPGLSDCAQSDTLLLPVRDPKILYANHCSKWLKTTTGGE